MARVPARTMSMTTLPTLRASQESVGLHGAAPVTHVDGPPAPARGHEARVRSAEQAHLDPERRGAARLRERGAPRGASGGGGSAVKIVRSMATGVGVPPVWSLAMTMVAVVTAWLRRHR